MNGRFSFLVDTLRRLPLAMYGFVFASAWGTWTRVGTDVPAGLGWPVGISAVRAVAFGMILCLCLYGSLRQGLARVRGGRGVQLAVMAVAVVLGVAVSLFAVAGVTVPPLAVTLVYGAVPAILYVAWGMLYMRLQVKDAFACVLVMYIMSALVNGVVFVLPAPVQSAVACSLLVIGGVLYVFASRSLELSSRSAARSDAGASSASPTSPVALAPDEERLPLWKFSLCLFAYALVLSLTTSFVPDSQGPLEEFQLHAIEIALALGFLVAIYVVRRPMRFPPLLIVLFAVLSGSLLLALLGQSALALIMFKMSTSFLSIVIWTVAVDFCRRSDVHPALIVSLFFFMRNLASAVVFLVRPLAPAEFWSGTGVGVVALWGLAMVTLLFVTEKDFIALKLFDGVLPQVPVGAGVVAELDVRCRAIAESYGCTPREVEIMSLLCMGKSKAYIGEELGLTESTVKSHVRNLYAKLGIHSKNDLQRLVGL